MGSILGITVAVTEAGGDRQRQRCHDVEQDCNSIDKQSDYEEDTRIHPFAAAAELDSMTHSLPAATNCQNLGGRTPGKLA
jgi:hypothetical protein